jgi:hypothetical protein
MRALYPCDAPPLGVAPIVVVVHVVVGEHGARGHLRRVVGAAAEETRWWRVHHGRARGIEAVGRVVHGEGVLGRSGYVVSRQGRRAIEPRGYPGRVVVL